MRASDLLPLAPFKLQGDHLPARVVADEIATTQARLNDLLAILQEQERVADGRLARPGDSRACDSGDGG